MLWQGTAWAASAAFATTTVWGVTPDTAPETTGTATAEPAAHMETIYTLLNRLHDILTFCIVSPRGAAYMVYKPAFYGALAVLGDAQRTAAEKGYSDVWKDATINTISSRYCHWTATQKETTSKSERLTPLSYVVGGNERRLWPADQGSGFHGSSDVNAPVP